MLDSALIIWSVVFVSFLVVWRVEYKYFTKLEKKKTREERQMKARDDINALFESQGFYSKKDDDED